MLFVIIFVPIRVMLLVAVYKMFRKGKRYYVLTREYNVKVLREVYWLTIRENKLEEGMNQYFTNT